MPSKKKEAATKAVKTDKGYDIVKKDVVVGRVGVNWDDKEAAKQAKSMAEVAVANADAKDNNAFQKAE